jgi:hypothetical protein
LLWFLYWFGIGFVMRLYNRFIHPEDRGMNSGVWYGLSRHAESFPLPGKRRIQEEYYALDQKPGRLYPP